MVRAVLGVILLASALDGQTLKFATLAPEGSTWMKVMTALDQEVRKGTQGRVSFKFFAGGVKGDEKSVLRQMKLGVVDSAGLAGLGLGDILPDARALDIPFLLRTDEEVDLVYEKLFPRFAGSLEKEGYVLLGLSEVGFVHFFSQKPVRKMEDLRATKCWMWSGDPLAEVALKKLGVSPIPLSLADVLTALQTGVIDTFYSPPLGAIALQWFTRVKYFQEFPMTHSTGGLVVTLKAFQKLKPEDQNLLRAAARRRMQELVKLTRKESQEALAALKKAGIEFIPPPDAEERKRFERIGEEIRTELTGPVYSKEALAEVMAVLEEFRRSQKKE
ncbi:MAG: TRAP transporter substrate-binding protein DctP [Planctomycetes bacterium]|nr:TRAP transporter substrate-binding protein DctP [Planctomycetota bacterium]